MNEQKVIEIIERLNGIQVTEESNLEDSGLNSLDIIETVMECEKEFNISIPDEYIETIQTVQELINLVNERV